MEVDILDALKDLQKSCVVPKNLTNSFGGYNFRNIEQINQEIKKKYKDSGKVVVKLDRELIAEPFFSVTKREIKYDKSGQIQSETITEYKGRDYIKSTATIISGSSEISSSAIMRVPFEKKGVDDSQITASTISFADKYAMGGLLLVSDGIDNDCFPSQDTENVKEVGSSVILGEKKLLNQKMLEKKMDNAQRASFFMKHSEMGMDTKEMLENFEDLYNNFIGEQHKKGSIK